MVNETQPSRFGIASKTASIILSAAILATTFTGLGTVASTEVEAASNSYGLVDNIQDGAILHCFDWKYNDIKAELQNIAEAGFSAVQTSPAQPANSGQWWWLYQPKGFYVATNALGTKEELQALCTAADSYGIKVVVDVVANHLAGDHSDIQSDLKDSQYWHNNSGGIDYSNRWQIHQNDIGMPDINSEHSYVQQVVAGYVKELAGIGVDGIRWDAAKHISVPSENSNQFWPTVTSAADLWNYGEILDDPVANNDTLAASLMKEYTNYISVTDSGYCATIRMAFRNGTVPTSIGNYSERGVAKSKLVYWAESHDTYSNDNPDGKWDSSQFISQNKIDRAYAVVAAQNYSSVLYFSRPSQTSKDSIKCGEKGSTHFTSPEVAEVNKFKNAMNGQKEYYTTGSNCSVVCREKGAVIVAGSGENFEVTVPNGGGIVAPGTYTDQVSGNTWTVTSSTISGKIGSTGIVVLYNPGSVVTGGVSASPATGTSFTDTLTVTLNASDVTNATYKTSEGASGSYTNGQTIVVGSSTAEGSSVTVTLTGTKSDGSSATATYTYKKTAPKEYPTLNGGGFVFDNSTKNWSTVNAYVYDESGSSVVTNGEWPGVKMTDCGNGYWKYELDSKFSSSSSVQVIFNNGSEQIPASQEPGFKMTGTDKKVYENGSWTDIPDVPIPTEPTVTSNKASGTKFTTETLDITLTLANATSGTYSVDDGPEKTFTGSKTITIGEGKIGDSTVTVKATATDSNGTTKSYTFTYEKDYVVTTSSSSASAVTGKYATNPNGQVGKNKTITSASDFTEDMIIAQGVANDDPRIFRGSHEAPVYDTYALYAAWDDTNLYLGWQFTNVTDVVDPAQGYPTSDNGKPWNGDIPQMLAFDLGTGNSADMSSGTLASGYVWGLKVGFETDIDALMCFSSKPGVGQPALFKTGSDGYFNYDEGVTLFKEGGISFQYEDGFFGSSLIGIKANGYEGYVPDDLLSSSSNWVNFLNEGHSTSQDTFYYITIPLSTLGVTKSYIESNGIGVMHISTFGEGGIASIPMDMTMLDNATTAYSQDDSTSAEKEDTDTVTVPLARIGADNGSGGGGGGGTTTTPLQVNFGTDRSAPQLTTTALTLKAIGYGGTAPYQYQFYVDGTSVKSKSTTDTYSWTPSTSGSHTLKCVITDSTGATATVSKTFTAEGNSVISDLANNSTMSATSITLGSSVTLKGAATGGTGSYQYAYYYKKASSTSWTTAKGYSTTTSVSITPANATTYDVCIKVKDSNGTEVNKYLTLTVNSSATALTNNSTMSATSITLGSSVTLKGAATGGTSPYQYVYYYKKASSTSWTTAKALSTTTSTSITPESATTYDVCIKVKDAAGTLVAKYFTLTVKSAATALTNNSTVSATSITLGNTVTVKGVATGGTGSYQYAYFYKRAASSEWTTVKGYSTTTSVSVKPQKATTYDVCVKIKDSAGTVTKKYFTVKVTAALTNSSTVSATSIVLGNSITLKGVATGGTSSYKYSYYYKRAASSTWTTIKGYSTTTSVSVKPQKATTYDVCIKVKDTAGTEAKKYFTVKVNAVLANSSTMAATSITLGDTVKLTGAATGGISPYKYSYYYKKTTDSSWTTAKGYSTTTSVSIKPAKATTYDVCIKVKDAAGTEAKKYFTLTVKPAALTNNSTVSATSIDLDSSITLKGVATGGTSPYQYSYYYKRAASSTWTTIKGYSTTTSVSVKPQKATTYDVCIKVKDAAGTEAKKYFTVNVLGPLTATAKVSASSTTLGSSVTVTAGATGGTSPYSYEIKYLKLGSSTWTTLKAYSTTATKIFTPSSAGTYSIEVNVKDAKGTVSTAYTSLTVS